MRILQFNSLTCVVAALLIASAPVAVLEAEESQLSSPLKGKSTPVLRDARARRVGPELQALYDQYVVHQANLSDQPFGTDIPHLRVADDMVAIDAVADGDPADLVAALKALGATNVVAFKRVISARLPVAAIPALANLASLRFARPVRVMTNVGNTTSQADVAMNTDDARGSFGVDGSGVTVGVLSDSFNCGAGAPGSYATDVGTADLPLGIEVLADEACGSDEGRGMLQLIHDIAPGAELSFHTAFAGIADFALGIQELAGCPTGSEAGCTPAADPAEVVVDDVGYFAQPMFQDGIIAQAVDVVATAGVPYFSSAGNSGSSSWDGSPFDSSGIEPPGYADGTEGDAHDFDPGAGVDIYQLVTFPTGDTVISFQWDQPFFSVSGAPGSGNDMDICFYTEPPGAVPVSCSVDVNVGADPVELASITNTGPPTSANIVIIKWSPGGGPDPGTLKYVAFNSGFSVDDPYGNTAGSTTYGHNNATGAVAVGAAYYFFTPEFGTTPATLETFSSRGGTPILFDTAGVALGAPELRMRPQIVAPDGTNTTFFGSPDDPGTGCCEGDGFPNFFGTSAAAPHAAAVTALMMDAFPGLLPGGVEDILTSGAADMETAGFDFDSGYGLIDGHTAVASVHGSTSCDGIANLVLSGTPSSGSGTFSAMTSISYSDGNFAGFDAYAPTHSFSPNTVVGTSTSFNNCI